MRPVDIWKRADRAGRARLLGILVFFAAGIALTVLGIRWAVELRDPAALEAFRERIAALGPGGALVLLAIQYVQVVMAFIPGGPIQIVAGALYGPVGALALIVAGLVLANATIFALTRRFGKKAMRLFVGTRELSDYRFLGALARPSVPVLILFLIPGTPKDALTYIFALTEIGLARFTVLSIAARLPAILVSVFAGDSLLRGKFLIAAILFAITAALGIAGYFVGRHFGNTRRIEDDED